jgi:hypothetical protein
MFNIRVLDSHTQDAGPLHCREWYMNILARASVAVAVTLGVAATTSVDAALVGVDSLGSIVVVELGRPSQASDTLPLVVLQSGLSNGNFDKTSKLRTRGELGLLVQVQSSAHLQKKTLLIPGGEIERLIHGRRILLPAASDRLDASRSDSVQRASVLVEQNVFAKHIGAIIAVIVLIEVGERSKVKGCVIQVVGNTVADLDVRRRHKDLASLGPDANVRLEGQQLGEVGVVGFDLGHAALS